MRKDASQLSVGLAVALLTTAIGGGMYVGALANDVETLKQQQQEKNHDHDNITTLKADVATMKGDIKVTKETLSTMALILARIEQKVE